MHAALHTRHGGKVRLSQEGFGDLVYYNETTLIEMKYITNDGRYDRTNCTNFGLRTLPLSQKEYVTTGQMAKLPHGQSDHLNY